MTILNDFLYYYENGSKIISPWGKEMIPLLLISYCPTYKLPKNQIESSSSFFLGCNYLRTAVRGDYERIELDIWANNKNMYVNVLRHANSICVRWNSNVIRV